MNLNKTKNLLFVGLVLVAMSSCVSKKAFSALQTENNDLAMKLEQLQKEFDATAQSQGQELESLKNSNSNLQSENSKLTSNIDQVKGEMNSKMTEVQSSVDDKQRQIDMLRGELNGAFADIDIAVTNSDARLKDIENFLYLDLADGINFKSGGTNVDPNDKESLEMLAAMLKSNDKIALMIEGHTDSRTIANEKYKDNWDLSVNRATQVVRKLIEMGVNPEQLIASGRSQYMPSDDNTTSDGRMNNRRTEAILIPNVGKLYKAHKDINK